MFIETLFFHSLFVVFGGLFLALVCLVWAPIGGIIGALSARYKGLNARSYGIASAIYSALFLLPWMYLVLRMYGISIPRILVRITYVVLYVYLWALGSVAFMSCTSFFPARGEGWVAILLILNVLTVFISYGMLRGATRREGKIVHGVQTETLPDIRYIIPFALTLAWSLVSIAVLYVLSHATDIPTIP